MQVNSIDSDLIRILLGGTPLRLDPATGLPTSRVRRLLLGPSVYGAALSLSLFSDQS